MKKINLLYLVGLAVLLIFPSCEDPWTGGEVIIKELSIVNGNVDGCWMDSVQLYAVDQDGDTTTNVWWISSNSTVTVTSTGLAILNGKLLDDDGNPEQYDVGFVTASAHVMAKAVADNITSDPILVKSTNPSSIEQLTGTWLAKSLEGDTVGTTSGSYVYQSLITNSDGTWSGEVRTDNDTTTGSGYFSSINTQWTGWSTVDSTNATVTWVTKNPNSLKEFSSYCSDNDGTVVGTSNDSCRVISSGDTTYLTTTLFGTYCGNIGDQDGTTDASGTICTYTALDTTMKNGLLYNSDYSCELVDTLSTWVAPWNAGVSVRQ